MRTRDSGIERNHLIEFAQYAQGRQGNNFLTSNSRRFSDRYPQSGGPVQVGDLSHIGGMPWQRLHDIEIGAMFDGTDRQVWPLVRKHYPDKAEGQCRTIIHAWLATGLLYPKDYDDPVQRKLRKGLYVDDAKRPS